MANAPSRPPNLLSPAKRPRNTVIAPFIRFLRKVKGLLVAQKLPRIAQKTCELYLEGSNAALQARCQRVLQTRLSLNPKQLYRFFHTSIGELLLDWVERFFKWPSHHNPKQSLRELLVQMAADPAGLSLLSALRHFPETLQFNLDQLLFTAKRVEWLIEATRIATETIHQLSKAEAQLIPAQHFATLPDLRTVGEFAVQRSHLTLSGRRRDDCLEEDTCPLEVICYEPDPWPLQPVPVIVQSHGLASKPDGVDLYARHLASYGYFVVTPQHPGSDVEQIRRMLSGDRAEVFKLSTFIDRPLDISYLLDQLAQGFGSAWAGKLNLERVGIMGHFFGAYTAFALAGATIHFKRLEQACGLPTPDPNFSMLLQCQALVLPRQLYQLQDHRIQAILCLDSVGSEIFGTTGLAQIQVPVMLIAGEHDMVAPLVLEQIRIFQGLTGFNQYLALVRGKSHIRDLQRFVSDLNLEIDWSPQSVSATGTNALVDAPIKALSIAFFDRYLKPEKRDIEAYLSADYAAYLSHSPDALGLISEKSKATLDKKLQCLDSQWMAEFSSPTVTAKNVRRDKSNTANQTAKQA
ncbi:MAG: alpha/beta hydrolase [Cyanobacteria bacterium J06635_15]